MRELLKYAELLAVLKLTNSSEKQNSVLQLKAKVRPGSLYSLNFKFVIQLLDRLILFSHRTGRNLNPTWFFADLL